MRLYQFFYTFRYFNKIIINIFLVSLTLFSLFSCNKSNTSLGIDCFITSIENKKVITYDDNIVNWDINDTMDFTSSIFLFNKNTYDVKQYPSKMRVNIFTEDVNNGKRTKLIDTMFNLNFLRSNTFLTKDFSVFFREKGDFIVRGGLFLDINEQIEEDNEENNILYLTDFINGFDTGWDWGKHSNYPLILSKRKNKSSFRKSSSSIFEKRIIVN